MLGQAALQGDGELHRAHGAFEFEQGAVAEEAENAPAVAFGERCDELGAQDVEGVERAAFVFAEQPAVTDNVSSNDRRQFAAHRSSPLKYIVGIMLIYL